MRRLVIVVARGLVVALPPLRPRKAKPHPTILRNGVGTGIHVPAGVRKSAFPSPLWGAGRGGGPKTRNLCLPLFDPLRRSFRLKRPVANGVPRISLPGVGAPSPIAPRRQPSPDDLLDATRLALRLRALGAALDDLPRQARRFARWKAARGRDAAAAPDRKEVAAGAQGRKRRIRRTWPLRPGRPPGQRPARLRTHEVHEILGDLHGLAFDALEHPDTS